MNALDRLASLLRGSQSAATERPFPRTGDLAPIIDALQKYNRAGSGANVSEDMQQLALRKFWDLQRFETLKDARLVSFSMCMPSRPSGPCIMEDRQRFQAVLDAQTGVDQWIHKPRWYRRCYQGLLRSYFTYDAKVAQAPTVGKKNWGDLKDYLRERTRNIIDSETSPDWVTTAAGNQQLFGDDPCAHYAADVLSGDTSKLDVLCEQLGVVKTSWFLRDLILAQVREATKLSHDRFTTLIPRLLELLSKHLMLRNAGLILMLDKYALMAQSGVNEPLRNASVEWWGNPWLSSNKTSWGGVHPATREMVSEWLKREFIEAFFTKLAEDGVGDRRRANFWLRYVKSMDNIEFALGGKALSSKDRDFEILRKKMKGLYTELKTTDHSNNAFIMTMGDLVAVESGGMGNAFYGYDVRKTLPFDASRPVGLTVNGVNSLKHKNRMLWMQHQDGIKGWGKWEEMFEATLKENFAIYPNTAKKPVVERAVVPVPATIAPVGLRLPIESLENGQHVPDAGVEHDFSKDELLAYANRHELRVHDKRKLNGNLWVRTDDKDLQVNKKLLDWGFEYKPGKGWWR